MPAFTPAINSLITGLSDFWQRFFADKDFLESLYSATEEQLGQAYLDLVTQVLNVSIDQVPVLRKEYWKNLVIRSTDVSYDHEDAVYPYSVDALGSITKLKFLLNRIYEPTTALETPQDFVVDAGTGHLRFRANPLSHTGVAVRQVTIAPKLYRTGRDVSVSGSTVTILGETQYGFDGEAYNDSTVRSASASFTADDVGAAFVITSGGATVTATVVSVLSSNVVLLDTVLADSTGSAWSLRHPYYFSSLDVGTTIQVTYAGSVTELTVATVVTPLSVTVTGDTTALDGLEGLSWTHQSATTATEMSWWIPDALSDLDDMYNSFGHLVASYQPSSESYRALIAGIMRLYILGPTAGRIESAFNVLTGIPVVREDGEEFVSVETYTDLLDRVTTSRRTYVIPAGSMRSEVTAGYVFSAFESLTSVFKVQDAVSDPDWFHNDLVPEELLPGMSVGQRTIDPELYPYTLGGAAWHLGDPHLQVGADHDGYIPQDIIGKDMFLAGAATDLLVEDGYVDASVIGRAIIVDGVEYTIVAVTAAPDLTLQVASPTVNPVSFTALTYSGTVGTSGTTSDFVTMPGYTFTTDDVGRRVRMLGVTYEIYDVVGPHTARIRSLDGTSVTFPYGLATFTLAFVWRISARRPLQTTTGYVLMYDMLKRHVFQVEYYLQEFPAVPYPRLGADLYDALRVGKPAYTSFLVKAVSTLSDTVSVSDNLIIIVFQSLDDSVTEHNGALLVGTDTVIGSHYDDTMPDVAWMTTWRNIDTAGLYTVIGSDVVSQLALRLAATAPDGLVVEVDLYEVVTPGAPAVFVSTHTLTPTMPSPLLISGTGNVLVLDARTYGTADAHAVEIGYVMPAPSLYVDAMNTIDGSDGALLYGNTLWSEGAGFAESDVWRVIYLEYASIDYRCLISRVLSPDTVELTMPEDYSAANLSAVTGVSWYFGESFTRSTPVIIGGEDPVVLELPVVSGGNPAYMLDWPARVNVVVPGPEIPTFMLSAFEADREQLDDGETAPQMTDAVGSLNLVPPTAPQGALIGTDETGKYYYFNGVDTEYSSSSVVDATAGYTFFVVVKLLRTGNYQTIVGFGATTERGVLFGDSSGRLALQERQDGVSSIVTSTKELPSLEPLALMASCDSSVSMRVAIDRDDGLASFVSGPSGALPIVADYLRVGAPFTTVNTHGKMHLYALYLAPPNLSDAEVTEAYDYINARFPNVNPAMWAPSDMDTAAWYDFSKPETVIKSGAIITSVTDLSGNGRTATNPSLTGTNLSYPTTLNGLNALASAGSSVEMLRVPFFHAKTMFYVASTADTQYVILYGQNTSTYAGAVESGSAAANFALATNVHYRADGALLTPNTRATLYTALNGTHVGEVSLIDTPTWTALGLFSYGAASWYFTGTIAECILLDYEPTQQDRQRIEGYLAHKWGITANLAASHPYKNRPPRVAWREKRWYQPVLDADPTYAFVADPAHLRQNLDGDIQATPGTTVARMFNMGSTAEHAGQVSAVAEPKFVDGYALTVDTLDGTSDSVTFPDTNFHIRDMLDSRYFTVVIQYYDLAATGLQQVPLSLGLSNTTGVKGAYFSIAPTTGVLTFAIGDTNAAARTTLTYGVQTGAKTVAVVADSMLGTISGYVDGALVVTQALPSTLPTTGTLANAPSLLRAHASYYFTGRLRFAALYARPLTPDALTRIAAVRPIEPWITRAFEATDISQADATSVARWDDRINHAKAYQTSPTLKGVYHADDGTGRPYVTLDGVDDFFYTNVGTSTVSTIILVVDVLDAATASTFVDSNSSVGQHTLIGDTTYKVYATPTTADTGVAFTTGKQMLAVVFNGADTIFRKDGTTVAAPVGTPIAPPDIRIGAAYTGAQYTEMRIYAVYYAEGHAASTAELDIAHARCKQQWGTP